LLTAALTAFVAGSSARQPAAPESADLTGKYELTGGGYLVMSVNDAGRVEGFFERGGEFGRISGQAESGAVSATWIQESGSTACKTAVDGSNFWGKLTLTRDADGAVQTAWGSCEARPVAAEPAK
jgi:hypothetical protein